MTLVGLYQGAVPLIARGVFGGDQRFAPALWLPSPWWWITCVAIVAVAVAAVAAIDGARKQRFPDRSPVPDRADVAGVAMPDASSSPDLSSCGYAALSGLVFLLSIYNGIAPFIARLVFDGDLLLALPLRLPSPWWWITSMAVIGVAMALLTAIDNAKQRRADG